MNVRLVLSWLLAVPMLFLLLFSALLLCGSLILLAFHGPDSQRIFFVAGSCFYLFCAHLLFFGSYVANPSLYSSHLKFISPLLHSKTSLLISSVIYVISFGYLLHNFKIL